MSSQAPSGCTSSIREKSECAATESWTLGNGLRVVLQPCHRLPLVTLHLTFLSGSAADRPGFSGLAHLAEHLAFSGPGNDSHLSWPAEVQQLGGLPGATTSYDRTTFSTVVASHQLDIVLGIESRRMANAATAASPTALQRQRQILLQESRQRASGRPATVALEELQRLLFPPGHPYHHPPSGTVAGVEAVDSQVVEEFLARNYTPNNAVLTLVGDVSRAHAEAACEHYFASIPAGPTRPSVEFPAFVSAPRHEQHKSSLPVARVYIGYTLPGQGEAEWYLSALLAVWLAVGKTSCLRRQLVDEASVAQRVEAIRISRRHASSLCIAAVGRPGVSSANLTSTLIDALDSNLTQDPDPQQLQRARKKVLTDFYAEIQRAQRRADLLTWEMGYHGQLRDTRLESQRHGALDSSLVGPMCERLHRQRGNAVLTYAARGESS